MSTQMHESFVPRTNSFGARLALIRWQMGWNMKEAALACGFSQQSWRGWELQGHDPRGFAEVAERISERTGIDEYWILTGKEQSAGPGGPGEGESSPKIEQVSKSQPLD
ncbi:helix-turn-helix transcriptional regulator [Arthrobacter sp. UYCu712]|uniref:helix-turn-helix domain-containing protein n=1 Tax=Arthrobacter sp. UYCu712 TaxID=3156340 RepID=UPI00339437AC